MKGKIDLGSHMLQIYLNEEVYKYFVIEAFGSDERVYVNVFWKYTEPRQIWTTRSII